MGILTNNILTSDNLNISANLDMNDFQINNLADPTSAQDAVTKEYADNLALDAGDVNSVFGRAGTVVAVSGDYTASQITNVPSGNISSITVQAALNELDTEKQAIGNYITALTGDVTATGPNSATATLSNTTVTASTYGSGTQVGQFTVDSKGRITGASNVTITSSSPSGTAGGDLDGTYPNPTVAKINGAILGDTTVLAGNILVGFPDEADGQWVSVAMHGDIGLDETGDASIQPNVVTTDMLIGADADTSSLFIVNPTQTTNTGNYNTALGYQALTANTSGAESNAFGAYALWKNTDGFDNSAFGTYALQENLSGYYNSAFGANSLEYNTGYHNTAFGGLAGSSNVSGNQNTFLGYNADTTVPNLTNATAIGYNASVGQSNSIVLGNGSVSVGIGTSTPAYTLDVTGNIRATGSVLGTISAVTADNIYHPIITLDGITSNYNANLLYTISGGVGTLTTNAVKVTQNTGLQLADVSGNFLLTLKPNSTLTAARTLSLTTGDANRNLTMTGDATISNTNTGDITISGQNYLSLSSQVLTANQINLTSNVTGTLPATSGGTGRSTYTLGDTLYSSASNTLSALAGNTTATKQYLSQTGTGSVSAAPVWATIDGSDITGAALTKSNDTNVTITLGGTPLTALLKATSITMGWQGHLALSRGGTNADLSATGGTSQVLKQTTAGGTITVAQLAASDLSNGTTGSNSVVLATSPTLTTPNIGDATGLGLVLTPTSTSGNQLNMTAGIAGELGGLISNSTNGSSSYAKMKIGASGGGEVRLESLAGTFSGSRFGLSAGQAGIINSFASIYLVAGTDGSSSGNSVKVAEIHPSNYFRFYGGVRYVMATVNGNYTMGINDCYLNVDTSAAHTITLPSASAVGQGWTAIIYDATGGALTNNVTINRAGSDTINGATSKVLNLAYSGKIFISDGSSTWYSAAWSGS